MSPVDSKCDEITEIAHTEIKSPTVQPPSSNHPEVTQRELDHSVRLNNHEQYCECDYCDSDDPIGFFTCTCSQCDPNLDHMNYGFRSGRHSSICQCRSYLTCTTYVHIRTGHWNQCQCENCANEMTSLSREHCQCPICNVRSYITLRSSTRFE